MNVEQAIAIVAKQLVANEARGIQWEDMPDIGEDDWQRVAVECIRLTPEPSWFNEAMTLLEERAVAWMEKQ